jgi:outer membrane protein assembly factor BamE
MRRLSLSRSLCAISAALCLGGMTGCSTVKPYKPEVVQGNFISREQVQALRAGMPRAVVREILGTPLVASVFHTDRWDYAFSIRRQGAEPQLRRLSVFFQGDRLLRIEGDELPTEAEFAAQLEGRKATPKVPLLKLPAESTPAKTNATGNAASNPVSASAPKAYPPLERD